MKFHIAKPAQYIIEALEKHGYEAYAVGGCIRDILTGREPKDWDIATNALAQDVKRCFYNDKMIETGLRHGTVTVLIDHMPVEITTYRVDGNYSDNRRPDEVRFVDSLEQDLSRRDFTINAMAYHPNKGLFDPFGGQSDIGDKIIRCVGNADERFKEDALRIMRALRFSSDLNFSIEKQTSISIHQNKNLLKRIANERFINEFNKLLVGENAATILNEYSDVIAVMIPEIKVMVGFDQKNPHHHLDVWQHTVKSIENCPRDIIIRLTMFFHDSGKPDKFFTDEKGIGHFYGHPKRSAQIAEAVMSRLRYDKNTINEVKILITNHDNPIPPKETKIKIWLGKIGETMMRKLLNIKRADAKAQNPAFVKQRLNEIDKVEKILNKIIREDQCFCLKDLAVTGSDLIAAGVAQSPQLGAILETLLSLVINGQIKNERQQLLDKGIRLYRKNINV